MNHRVTGSLSNWTPIGAPEKALPSVGTMARNFVSSVGRTARMVASGANPVASEEVVASRRDVCAGCEFRRGEDDRCSKCGCYLRAKLWLTSERCPVGKW